jgi:hypothetical protein
MRQLQYMLRLHHDGVSARATGRALGVARRLQRRAAGWPTSDRNPGLLRIGTGSRFRLGYTAGFVGIRNPHRCGH